MKIHMLLAFAGLAIGFAGPAFAQQKEPSLSEQDRDAWPVHAELGGSGPPRASRAEAVQPRGGRRAPVLGHSIGWPLWA